MLWAKPFAEIEVVERGEGQRFLWSLQGGDGLWLHRALQVLSTLVPKPRVSEA